MLLEKFQYGRKVEIALLKEMTIEYHQFRIQIFERDIKRNNKGGGGLHRGVIAKRGAIFTSRDSQPPGRILSRAASYIMDVVSPALDTPTAAAAAAAREKL